MQEFEKQSEIMDMREEMMNDAIDDAMGDDNDEEERQEPSSSGVARVGVTRGGNRRTQKNLGPF